MEKKKRIFAFKAILAALILAASSGGSIWGQVQMDCKNAFGAGESRWATRGTQPITSDADGALAQDPNTPPNLSIIIGGVANVVGEIWSGTGTPFGTGCGVTFPGYSCHNCTGSSINVPSRYTGCDNTFFKEHNGSAICSHITKSAFDATGGTETVVHINSGALGTDGTNTNVKHPSTPAFDVNYFYFKDILYYWYTYTRTQGAAHTCSWYAGTPPMLQTCIYHDASFTTATGNGFVGQGRILIEAGSHIHLLKDISADGGTNSKAVLDLPNAGTPYSLMVDGEIREDKIAAQKTGEITNINPMLTDALIGVYTGYYPKSGGKIKTNAAGGTILIGDNIIGQDAMEITTTTATVPRGGFQGSTVYTGTDIGVPGTANLGNYGSHPMTISHASTLIGISGNNVGTAAMQIYNHSCNSLTFNSIPLTVNINDAGFFIIDGYKDVNFESAQVLTASNSGRTIINGGTVNIKAPHKFDGSAAPTVPDEAYYSINAYKADAAKSRVHFDTWGTNSSFWNGTFQDCGTGDINLIAKTADVKGTGNGHLLWNADHDINGNGQGSVVHFTMEGDGHMRWFAGSNIKTDDGVYFSNTGTAVGHTEWFAGNNITTNDTAKFVHSNTTENTNYINITAQNGNITANKWYNVAISNPSRVTITAPNTADATSLFFPSTTNHRSVVPYTGTYPSRGNIFFRDSLNLHRLATSGDASMTEIIAGNHIATAMVNYVSKNADHGDSMRIISQNGDIFLGYNINNPGTGSPNSHTGLSYDLNRFVYDIPNPVPDGKLLIRAGDKDDVDNNLQTDGGNIYFTHLVHTLADGSNYDTEISIPFSNWYKCNSAWTNNLLLHNRRGEAMWNYENSGIIGGVSKCFIEGATPDKCDSVGLMYRGSNGNLTLDAGTRGNIIINNGAKVAFQDGTGNAIFRTRDGDIDMRYKFDADSMKGGLLFLAQLKKFEDLSKIGYCGCEEERNNVYLQDFQYIAGENSGSVFVGADNNIKLNYGGLQNKGTRQDPFLSEDYNPANPGEKIGRGYPCGVDYHCDMHDSVNRARDFVLDFYKDKNNNEVQSGGFAAVASDQIDVYKNFIYNGGKGSGMSSVPETGTLHGEGVAGYGLYMKTQGNKKNWNTNIFLNTPKCPMGCSGFECNGGYLHLVSRMTFHADARIYAHNQKVYLGSPVIESFGPFELNTDSLKGGNTQIVLQADSLILHDSLIIKGKNTTLRSWSGLKKDRPIMKFGYMRRTPPFTEYKYKDIECEPCHYYIRGSKNPLHMLDTITIRFEDEAYLERLNSVVFDHTVITFLTDSFDHKLGAPVLDAKIYVDTLKVRNQVDLFADKNHTRDANFELISEEQMHSKDYAGVYMRHYHMEPIGPCGRNYSELWLAHDPALDVITYSTFGGFGLQHSDVHVETMANLNPGFTSLRLRGQCYEQRCGTLTMRDLRLDGGAQLHFSVGTTQGINGEYSDAISVEKLTTYGRVDVNIEIRPCEKMEARCYPLIYYKSQTENSLNNLNLVTKKLNIDGVDVPLALDFTTTPGIVYLCVGNIVPPSVSRSIRIPSVAGVMTTPSAGITYTPSGSDFIFKAKYSSKPLVVRTNRIINGVPEVLSGVKNANGEYEYKILQVRQDIVLTIGPDEVANTSIDGTDVWSHGEKIYIRVEREDIASIYSVAGQLIRRIELPEGDTSIPMQRGVYVVTLKDGSVHKVIVK